MPSGLDAPAKLVVEGEAALVERARHGDREAFGALYDLYLAGVYRFACRRSQGRAAAEELTAQTFHRALEAIGGYQPRGLPFGAWVYRIARNLAIDAARREGRTLPLEAAYRNGREPQAPDTPDEPIIARQALDQAWAAVGRLPPLQRRAVTLRFSQGLSHAEVGAVIGRSQAATKQLTYRAIQALRKMLEVETP